MLYLLSVDIHVVLKHETTKCTCDDWWVRRVRRLVGNTCEKTGRLDVSDDWWVRRMRRRQVGQTYETAGWLDVCTNGESDV